MLSTPAHNQLRRCLLWELLKRNHWRLLDGKETKCCQLRVYLLSLYVKGVHALPCVLQILDDWGLLPLWPNI